MTTSDNLKGAYGDIKPYGLPIDQQHSAQWTSTSSAGPTPPPAPKETGK